MKIQNKKERALKIAQKLKELYPKPVTELKYKTKWQFVVAVVLSAQCTDDRVNMVTKELFEKYRTVNDFAGADWKELSDDMSSITYHNSKAKNIVSASKIIRDEFGGRVPKSKVDLMRLHGVGSKTANVVLGELFDIWEGIAVDTHVRRFALRFELTKNTDPNKIEKDLEELIPKKYWKYMNNGFVLYGRYICPARLHDCSEHALTKLYPKANHIWPKSR